MRKSIFDKQTLISVQSFYLHSFEFISTYLHTCRFIWLLLRLWVKVYYSDLNSHEAFEGVRGLCKMHKVKYASFEELVAFLNCMKIIQRKLSVVHFSMKNIFIKVLEKLFATKTYGFFSNVIENCSKLGQTAQPSFGHIPLILLKWAIMCKVIRWLQTIVHCHNFYIITIGWITSFRPTISPGPPAFFLFPKYCPFLAKKLFSDGK